MDDVASNLAKNLRQLRKIRRLSQQQVAEMAGIPRPTWAHLESGAGNPTLAVLMKVAGALHVSIEELLASPRATARHYTPDQLPRRRQGTVEIRKLLPDPMPGSQSHLSSQ